MGSDELVVALRKLLGRNRFPPPHPRGQAIPGCAFGYRVDERLKAVEGHLEELGGRLNNLCYLVVGAVLVEVVLRLLK